MMTDDARLKIWYGTTGSGKTFNMRTRMDSEFRVIVFDTMAEPKFEGCPTWTGVCNCQDMGENKHFAKDAYGAVCDSTEDAIKLLAKNTPRFRIRLQFIDIERFNFMCSLAVKAPHGKGVLKNTLFVIDEGSTFTKANWAPPQLLNITRLGRHTGTRLWISTQRPPDLAMTIRSQAKEVYLFQMHEEVDLAVFRGRLPDSELSKLPQLARGQFLTWHPSQAKDPASTLGPEQELPKEIPPVTGGMEEPTHGNVHEEE